jgi:hypothetical protein
VASVAEPALPMKKPSPQVSASGLLKLIGHAAMGVAMGLGFALILISMNPSDIATLITHGGSQGITVFVATLVLTFGIGATLTGAILIMTEQK